MDENTQENQVAINAPTDKEYTEIIKSELEVDRKFVEEEGEPAKISYYCRHCKKQTSPKRVGKKLSFQCAECGHQPISFGTENSIANYYSGK